MINIFIDFKIVFLPDKDSPFYCIFATKYNANEINQTMVEGAESKRVLEKAIIYYYFRIRHARRETLRHRLDRLYRIQYSGRDLG